MWPTFLITFREIIEAFFMVGTILGLLTKLNNKRGVKTVWLSTFFAITTSLVILLGGNIVGIKTKNIYGVNESIIEGSLMIISSFLGGLLKSLFGITQKMDIVQLVIYFLFLLFMNGWVIYHSQILNKTRALN